MKTRIITSIVAIAVFIGVLLAPPIVFPIALAAVIFVMLYEAFGATKASKGMKITEYICAVLILLSGLPFVLGYNFHTTAELCALAAITIIVINMGMIVFLHGKWSYKDVLSNAFLTMYITISTSLIMITKAYFGTMYMLLIFISAWSTDTFAYFTGKFIGKHKLIPHVSPNKTVEGSVGGVVGAMLICVIYLMITDLIYKTNIMWLPAGMLVGLIGGVFSQLGDLVMSAIKRDTGVKDFGKIFPGHGGFLDRFDSVIFIAPFIFGILILISTFMEL